MSHRGEANVITGSGAPITSPMLREMLGKIGLDEGDVVLAHASLSRMGWIVGGTQTVLDALLATLGPRGTLVMPGFSSQLSDPTVWDHPPAPMEWHQTILDNMPVFDPERTPTRGMSKLNDALRALNGTKRSNHPIDSFLAFGANAGEIVGDHPLSPTFGRDGPLGKLYDLNAKVLFLGSSFDTCTCFHLAEYDNPNAKWVPARYPMRSIDGVTKWVRVEELDFQEGLFARLGSDFVRDTNCVKDLGQMRLFAMRDAVEYARNWFRSDG